MDTVSRFGANITLLYRALKILFHAVGLAFSQNFLRMATRDPFHATSFDVTSINDIRTPLHILSHLVDERFADP